MTLIGYGLPICDVRLTGLQLFESCFKPFVKYRSDIGHFSFLWHNNFTYRFVEYFCQWFCNFCCNVFKKLWCYSISLGAISSRSLLILDL